MRPTLKINGKKLAAAREAAFLTQLQLAEKVGVREKSVQRVELGKNAGISPGRAAKYAAALGMTPEKFLSDIATTGKVEHVAYDPDAAAVRWLEGFVKRSNAAKLIKQLKPATVDAWRKLLLNSAVGRGVNVEDRHDGASTRQRE